MRGYVSITIDGVKDFQFNGEKDIGGVPIVFFHRAYNNPDRAYLDISWSALA